MNIQVDYDGYASKMRQLVLAGVDLETEARFVDMLCNRNSRILDIGCGIGTTVSALRRKGHMAFGVDPTDAVLKVARELHEPSWYAKISATDLHAQTLKDAGFPLRFEAILMSGNVPYFLNDDELSQALGHAAQLLVPGGILLAGTTAKVRGGPVDQDQAVKSSGLTLLHRYANWHFGPFTDRAPWSVSVYRAGDQALVYDAPDGRFILRN